MKIPGQISVAINSDVEYFHGLAHAMVDREYSPPMRSGLAQSEAGASGLALLPARLLQSWCVDAL